MNHGQRPIYLYHPGNYHGSAKKVGRRRRSTATA